VLETGTVTRVGGEKPIAVDVRVVAATNRDPEQAVREGKLREDLWYRLNVFPVPLPPLRQRRGDVTLLAQHFLAELNMANSSNKRWGDSALAALERYAWPGNVRELKNLVHRAFILADQEVDAGCLPTLTNSNGGSPPLTADDDQVLQVRVGSSVADVEKRLIFATLEQVAGNKQKAAEILGVSLKTLYNRLSAYKTQ
jgi:DNA-binding NtrC family response regulator